MGLKIRGSVWWVYDKGKRFSTKIAVEPKTVVVNGEVRKAKDLANDILIKFRNKVVEGVYNERGPENKKTLQDLIERFMLEHGNDLASAEFLHKVHADGRVTGYAARLYEFFEKEIKLTAITRDQVAQYKAKRKKDGLSPAGINREIALLRAAFEYAIDEWEWDLNQPVRKMVPGEVKRTRWLGEKGEQEESALRKACPDRLWSIAELVIHTGLRLEEILLLTWNYVDLKRQVLTVAKSKNGEARSIPLDEVAMSILASQIRSTKTEHVFYNRGHKRFGNNYVSKWFSEIVDKAGLEDFHFHDLRHTFGTRQAQNGADLYVISKLMGHKDLKMTQRYAHHCTESLRAGMRSTKSAQRGQASLMPVQVNQ